MNEQDVQKSENIASKILRALAILGLVAVLALVAWLVVQGVRWAPNAGSGVGSVFSSITSFFGGDEEEETQEEHITFDLETRTLTHGVPARIAWEYTGENMPEEYVFTYTCHRNVVFILQGAVGAQEIACGSRFVVAGDSFTIIPRSLDSRFADVEIKVTAGNIADSSLVTIVNSGALLAEGEDVVETTTPVEVQVPVVDTETSEEPEGVMSTPTEPETVEVVETTPDVPPLPTLPVEEDNTPVTPVVTTPVAPTPIPEATTPPAVPTLAPVATTPPVVHTIQTRTPADLVVAIKETGVYLEVSGENTFFPISPIPTDKRAAVVFTVTNRGGSQTGAWAFVAALPVEGDESYRYTSPAQASLLPNAQVEFTLGFDQVLEEDEGTIRIEVVPTQASDRPGNNIDATVVELR